MIACSISDGICDTTGGARGVGKHWQPERGFAKVSLEAADRCFSLLNYLALAHMQAVAQMLYISLWSACHLLQLPFLEAFLM